MIASDVAPNHQFLSAVKPVLCPCATTLSGFVLAVLAFRHNTLQFLLGSAFEHRCGGGLEIVGKADSGGLKFEHGLQEFTALDKRELRKVSILVDEQKTK